MEDKENVQLCTRCSSVLANHVMDNSKSVPYCSACAVQGRAPPLLCRCRNSSDVDSDDFVRTAQLNKSNGTLSVVDNGGHVHTESLDDTPQNVLPSSAELTEFTCQNSNTDFDCSSSFCSSLVSLSQEVDIASSDQLQDSQCASRCRPKQSSVERLRKQMEMLAHDEDFPVHYGITTDDHSALCCQSDVNEIDSEEHLMKYTAHSANCDEVLPSINVEDDGDGLIVSNMCQAVRPKSQRHLDGCTSDVSSDAVMSGQNCNSPFNSVRVNNSAMSLDDAMELPSKQTAVNEQPQRRKSTQSVRDEGDNSTPEGRYDCCSVLTHQKPQIHSTANSVESKLAAAYAVWLVKWLLLLLLVALVLLMICSVKPGWCRLGLLVDWRLRHLGGAPPV